MSLNRAAWLTARRAPLNVRDAPYTHPGHDEVVIRNRAVAVNPLDWTIAVAGHVLYPWITVPFVLGADLAGEVVEVGEGVTRLVVGDRVLALTEGTDKDSNSSARGAFQHYSVVLERLTSPVPAAMTYEEAAVVPLAAATAASALFQRDYLALDHPSARPVASGRVLLVWGGSTSVGIAAIQLAVAAGYEVITTASPHNVDLVRRLGASRVFDYASPGAVQDIIAALRGRTVVGAIALGTGSAERCADVLTGCEGNRFLAMASPSVSFEKLAGARWGSLTLPRLLLRLSVSTVALQVRCRAHGIRPKFIWGTSLKKNEVAKVLFEDFLPSALAHGRYIPAPEPQVVGAGLESIQAGLDAQMAGVSARKVIISL